MSETVIRYHERCKLDSPSGARWQDDWTCCSLVIAGAANEASQELQATGIKRWIQQGARHSYCSYWLGLHHDADKLVLQSGHTDADTMWTRYHQGVEEADAKAFWNIRPARPVAENVISMVA